MRYFCLLCSILLSSLTVRAQDAPSVEAPVYKFAFFSYKMVMEAMPDYQQAVKSLDELRATYDSEMTRAEKDFDKQFAEYVDGLRSFPDNILLKRQKELQQLMTQTIDFKDEAKRMLKDAERQVMEPVEKRLQEAVDALGSEKNYDFIVNTDNNSYPFVNKAKAEDINNLLIERLK